MIVFREKVFTEDYKILEELRLRGVTNLNQLSSAEMGNPDVVASAHRVINEKKISIKARLAKKKPKKSISTFTPTKKYLYYLNKALNRK